MQQQSARGSGVSCTPPSPPSPTVTHSARLHSHLSMQGMNTIDRDKEGGRGGTVTGGSALRMGISVRGC